MTVLTSANSVVYRGNGATTAFAVPFKVLDEDHLRVSRQVFATGALDHTYIGTDYSYAGIGAPSGTLTLAGPALDDDYQLVIERIVPYTQDLDIVNAGGFYPETVEEQLDLTTMAVQQVADLASRAIVVPVGETAIALPAASLRAGRYLGFNALGAMVTLPGSVTASDVISIPALTNYGEVDTAAEAAATLAAALADVGFGGIIYVDAEAAIGTAPLANPGVDFIGQRPISHNANDDKGGRVFNKIGRNPFLLGWGLELLTKQVLNKIRTGAACKIVIIGDSNAAVWWGAIFEARLAGLPGVTVVNNAVSGSTIDNWRSNTGTINGTDKDFTATMALDPDLLINAYGGDTNGPRFGGTATSFDASLASVMTDVRSHANGGKTAMGLLTLTSAPMQLGGAMPIEGGAKQDELHSARVRSATLRTCMAPNIKSAFFDLNGLFCDAEMADLDGDVHTQNSMADLFAYTLFEWLIPSIYRGGAPTYIGTKAAAALPATYVDNVSSFRMADGAFDGFGFHVRPSFGATAHGLQFNWTYNTPDQVAFRHAYSGTLYTPWQYIGQGALAALTAAVGVFTNPADSTGMNVRRDGGMVSLQGMLTKNAAGTIAAGVTIATIPVDKRPAVQIPGIVLTCRDGAGGVAGAYEHIFCSIETNGTIVTRSAAASIVTGVHINDQFRFA